MIELRPVLLVVGIFLTVFSGLMLLPMLVDASMGDPNWQAFGASALVTGTLGGTLAAASWGRITSLTTKQGFLITTASWAALVLAASIPLWLGTKGMSFTDAFFEAMSGLTTTGSTVVTGLDTSPHGFLLWRSMLQWIGGVGVVIMAVGILPFLSVGGMQLFRSEAYEPSDKVFPGAGQMAIAIIWIYIALTFLCTTIYWAMGMVPFDAINHAMTTVATGGFSTRDASFGYFMDNPDIHGPIDLVASIFMLLGALPFTMFLFLIRGKIVTAFDDSQVKFFLIAVTILIAFMVGEAIEFGAYEPMTAVRHAIFNVISIITGTGYATTNYQLWGPFAVGFFFCVMFLGGCSGSTSCGLKIFRLQVVLAALSVHAARLAHPHRTTVPKYNHRPITDDVFISVMSFFFLYFAIFSSAAVILTFYGLDTVTALSAAGTAIANVGPGLGDVIGPSGNFQPLPDGVKWVLSITMLLGRLELFTVVVLLTPSFWRQ